MLTKSNVTVGDTVRVLPDGLLAKVTYNDSGVISGVYVQLSEDKYFKDNSYAKLEAGVTAILQKKNILPSRLVRSSNCCVKGCFTSSKVTVSDIVSKGKVQSYMELLTSSDVEFVAYCLEDSKVSYSVYQEHTILEMLGFKTCPSFVVSADVKASSLATVPVMLSYPFVLGYYICKDKEGILQLEKFRYERVESVERDVNVMGYIVSNVTFESGNSITVPYSCIVKYNVQKMSYIVVDDGNIVYCSDRSNKSKRVERQFKCKYCGSVINAPSEGYTACTYDNCPSKLYPVIETTVNTLKLPYMDYVTFMENVKSKNITCIVDLFNLEPYCNLTALCTASQVLRCVCPVSVVRSTEFFEKLVESAGSLDALNYYLEHPSEIVQDMKDLLNTRVCNDFDKWISNPENLLMVQQFMQLDNIKVQTKSKVNLDVPQLLRSKVVYLEGQFKHGSYSYVSAVLKSYGAEIAHTFDNRCSILVLGDLVKNPDSVPLVSIAQSYGIPVVTETYLFSKYDIDSDILKSY